MTINISVLKGDLNGKIVLVRYFFCRVYMQLAGSSLVKSLLQSLIDGNKHNKCVK